MQMELKSGHSVYTQHQVDGNSLITEDPMEAVECWVNAGAKRIQVVDVDAIRARQPVNAHKIAEIHRRYPSLEFQVAGISREEDVLIWLDAGAKYLIIHALFVARVLLPRCVCSMLVQSWWPSMLITDKSDTKDMRRTTTW